MATRRKNRMIDPGDTAQIGELSETLKAVLRVRPSLVSDFVKLSKNDVDVLQLRFRRSLEGFKTQIAAIYSAAGYRMRFRVRSVS